MKQAAAIIEWNQQGHHESYLQLYTQAFLQNQTPVIVLCSRPQKLTDWVEANIDLPRNQFTAIQLPSLPDSKHRKHSSFFSNYFKRLKLQQALKQGESALQAKCNWVHFACLYEHQGQTIENLVRTFKRPWTGLYLHPNNFYPTKELSPEKAKQAHTFKELLHDNQLKALLTLDENAAAKISHYYSKPVVVAPDLTETNLSAPRPFARKNQDTTIIGTLGHLLPSKGIIRIAELILEQKLKNHFLILAGAVPWKKFSKKEQSILHALEHSEWAWTQFERIETTGEYNALLNACDVLLATYIDFPHSSNTLTKAAYFEKPIVVNDGQLLAQRVRKYNLGEVVDHTDSNGLENAIRTITRSPQDWIQKNQPQWKAYQKEHSIDQLNTSIRETAQLLTE